MYAVLVDEERTANGSTRTIPIKADNDDHIVREEDWEDDDNTDEEERDREHAKFVQTQDLHAYSTIFIDAVTQHKQEPDDQKLQRAARECRNCKRRRFLMPKW